MPKNQRKRTGLTLIEVIVSLAIFLMSLVAIGQLITMASSQALRASLLVDGSERCQSKLAEYSVGALEMGGMSNSPFEDDPNWLWSSRCEEDPVVMGLWRVQVTVTRATQLGTPVIVTMEQMIIDPSIRGSTFDPEPMLPEETEGEDPASPSSGTTPAGG